MTQHQLQNREKISFLPTQEQLYSEVEKAHKIVDGSFYAQSGTDWITAARLENRFTDLSHVYSSITHSLAQGLASGAYTPEFAAQVREDIEGINTLVTTNATLKKHQSRLADASEGEVYVSRRARDGSVRVQDAYELQDAAYKNLDALLTSYSSTPSSAEVPPSQQTIVFPYEDAPALATEPTQDVKQHLGRRFISTVGKVAAGVMAFATLGVSPSSYSGPSDDPESHYQTTHEREIVSLSELENPEIVAGPRLLAYFGISPGASEDPSESLLPEDVYEEDSLVSKDDIVLDDVLEPSDSILLTPTVDRLSPEAKARLYDEEPGYERTDETLSWVHDFLLPLQQSSEDEERQPVTPLIDRLSPEMEQELYGEREDVSSDYTTSDYTTSDYTKTDYTEAPKLVHDDALVPEKEHPEKTPVTLDELVIEADDGVDDEADVQDVLDTSLYDSHTPLYDVQPVQITEGTLNDAIGTGAYTTLLHPSPLISIAAPSGLRYSALSYSDVEEAGFSVDDMVLVASGRDRYRIKPQDDATVLYIRQGGDEGRILARYENGLWLPHGEEDVQTHRLVPRGSIHSGGRRHTRELMPFKIEDVLWVKGDEVQFQYPKLDATTYGIYEDEHGRFFYDATNDPTKFQIIGVHYDDSGIASSISLQDVKITSEKRHGAAFVAGAATGAAVPALALPISAVSLYDAYVNDRGKKQSPLLEDFIDQEQAFFSSLGEQRLSPEQLETLAGFSEIKKGLFGRTTSAPLAFLDDTEEHIYPVTADHREAITLATDMPGVHAEVYFISQDRLRAGVHRFARGLSLEHMLEGHSLADAELNGSPVSYSYTTPHEVRGDTGILGWFGKRFRIWESSDTDQNHVAVLGVLRDETGDVLGYDTLGLRYVNPKSRSLQAFAWGAGIGATARTIADTTSSKSSGETEDVQRPNVPGTEQPTPPVEGRPIIPPVTSPTP